MVVALGYLHFGLVSINVSFGTLLAIMLADACVLSGLLMRKQSAWHLVNLAAIHMAIRKPFYDHAFVLPYGVAYIIPAALMFSLWVCRWEFNIRGWRWLDVIASFALASSTLLIRGYYFPQAHIEYADPAPPLLVQIVDCNHLGPGELLVFFYTSGVVVIGVELASRWVRERWRILGERGRTTRFHSNTKG